MTACTKKTAGLLAALALVCTMTGCGGTAADSADTQPPLEIGTVDLTDDRAFTDLSAYESRFKDAFSVASPVPETDLTFTLSDGGACVTGYEGGETVVVIPDTLGGAPVTAVAEGAFKDSPLRALCLPDTVTVIGTGALQGCSSLSTLKTPVFTCPGMDWFGALFGSTSYEINRANVPSSLTTLILCGGASAVPDYCFYGCTGLEAVSLPDTAAAVGDFAFYGCDRLAVVTLPDGLKTIGEYAFGNCLSLLTLTVPASAEWLGRSMLEGCRSIEALNIPFVGMDAAGTENGWLGFLFGAVDHTFSEGYVPASLIRVTVTGGTSLPANAFYECGGIREIILPGTLTFVGHRAFYRCAYLSSVTLPASLTFLSDEAFSGCVRLTSVDLSHVTSLGVQVFRGCSSLSDVVLPDCDVPAYTFEGTPYGLAH